MKLSLSLTFVGVYLIFNLLDLIAVVAFGWERPTNNALFNLVLAFACTWIIHETRKRNT